MGVGSWCTRGRSVNGRAFNCRWHLINIFYQITICFIPTFVVVVVVLVPLAVCNTGDIENYRKQCVNHLNDTPSHRCSSQSLTWKMHTFHSISRALSWHSSFVSQRNHQLHHSNSPQVWLHAFFYAVDSTGVGDGKMNDVSFRATAFMDRCQVIDRLGINTPHLQQIDSYRHTARFLSCM